MNVIDRYLLKQLNHSIKRGVDIKHNPTAFKEYKAELNTKYRIFYYNIIKTTDKSVFTIMCKRNNSTYIYSYNTATNDLILKGERKNVNT